MQVDDSDRAESKIDVFRNILYPSWVNQHYGKFGMVLGKEDKAAFREGEIDYISGVTFLVDKPLHWTSFDVVKKIRFAVKGALNVKKVKVGHAGTLDPLAEGLLIVCVGKHTKRIQEFQSLTKEYSGRIRLGAVTESYDAEKPEKNIQDISHLTEEDVMHAIEKFTGKIMQRPPAYSALKKGGVPMYKKARRGEEFDIPKREVEVYSFGIEKIEWPFIQFQVKCSKGTYIRSLAYDVGKELGVGGYLASLSRDAIGPYRKENAFEVNELTEWIKGEKE